MNKIFKGAAIALSASALLVSAVGCSGGRKPGQYDNEENAIVFSTQEVDGVFTPFFSTTAPDGEVAGLTQLGMIGNDRDGNVTYGDGEAVIAEDYAEVTEGSVKDVDLFTTYYYVLKNDVKYSDGVPLTIEDVLFNLYVYLDPAYYGSSTMYSTDIVGLADYRYQTRDWNEQQSADTVYHLAAQERVMALVDAKDDIMDEHDTAADANMSSSTFRGYLSEYTAANAGNDYFAHLAEDYDKAVEFFEEELNSDYTNSMDSYDDTVFTDRLGTKYKPFSTDVEVFLYNEGVITWNEQEGRLYSAAVNDPAEHKSWTKERAIEYMFNRKIPGSIDEVITGWQQTSNKLLEYIEAMAAEDAFDPDNLKIKNIEGIKFANFDKSVTVNGKTYEQPQYNDDDGSVKDGYNEVLSIKIKNIDPKAKWNFAFAVAPMHYYGDTEKYPFDYANNKFGVAFRSRTFMDETVNAPNKVGLPVGAGPYMAASYTGGTQNVTSSTFKNNNVIYFERNPYFNMGDGPDGVAKIKNLRYQVASSKNMLNSLYSGEINFVSPNAKPETITEIKAKASEGYGNKEIMTNGYGYIGFNASKIPNIRVRQVMMHSINTQKVVDYYGSSAKILHRSMSSESWAYPEGAIAYYPYIGGPIPAEAVNGDRVKINPDYVDFVQEKGKKAGETFTDEEQLEFVTSILEEEGYAKGGDGVMIKGTDKLKYDFVVVGSEEDHPAFNPLFQAGEFLNKAGFKIVTKTDKDGLKKLTTGDLTVWAAAWGSTIDPDMYQVYHMDSQATSVVAWGYPSIKNNQNKYSTEYGLIEDLSEVIDKARETNDQKERKGYYSEALDLVMKLAIELPTYQRTDLFAWDDYMIDSSTFVQNPTAIYGLTYDLYNISLRVS